MPEKLAIFVQNELNLDLQEIFHPVVAAGIQIDHIPLHHTQNEQHVIRAAKGYQYIVTGREPWTSKTFMACAKNLKMLVRFGAGYDTVDVDFATQLGIAVANAPGANSKAVAEHTLALMMSVLRNISRYDREMRSQDVQASISHSLEGTVALLGFGSIGQEVARLLRVFPVRVIAYDPYPNRQKAQELGVSLVSLDTALSQADILSLHLPAIREMQDFICDRTIAQMKDGVYLINTSRGCLVDEQALARALRSGKIAGAGLDTFKVEPFDRNSILKNVPNVVLTPHAAAVSTQGVRSVFESCARSIEQFLQGQRVDALLNPEYRHHIHQEQGA